MYEFFQKIVTISVPVFVVATMLNVGLTQTLSAIVKSLNNVPYVAKMLLANFVVAPAVMYAILRVVSFDQDLKTGLLLLGMCAGAPFLIKLVATAHEDIALAVAIMLLLMIITVAYVPLVLPHLLTGVSVSAMAIVRSLVVQLVLPIAVGMVAMAVVPKIAEPLQPIVAKIGNVALYVVLASTLVGYFPEVRDIIGTGALLVAVVFSLIAFGVGYLAGYPHQGLADVGALGTAQRNTAAGMIIATQNFASTPSVIVMMSLANAIGIVLLLFMAKRLDRNKAVADAPA